MSSQDESSRSDTPDIDYSVIRTAIQIGGKVVEQVMNGIHYGSDEVRNLLLEECDLILECKVCRNLFRSLPNFVAHKRVYCTPSYEEHKKKETEPTDIETEETVVIQPTSPKEGPDIDATASQKSTEEQSVIDKVINRSFEGQSRSYELYTKIAEKVEAKKAIKPTSTVTLKSILSNPNAVLMTVSEKGQNPNASENTNSVGSHNQATDTAGNVVKTITKTKPTISQLCEKLANRPIEPHRIQANSDVHTVSARSVRSRKSSPRKSMDNFIGMKDTNENRKSKTPSPSSVGNDVDIPLNEPDSIDSNADFCADMQAFISDYTLDSSWLSHCDIKSQKCKTCDKSFTTPYGLKFHCKMKHVDKLVQYPCSTCTKSFTYFTALARHLRKVHTKSESYIKYIQAKLKGKHGHRKSLDDAETESNETESSPEGGRKNMLALDTGYKKCDKCGKICWKAKSYNRHYQYCKGLTDNTSKLQNGELSPSKSTGQKEKEQIKKVNEKLKGPSNEVTENVKEKPKFNENLTIRTRKQLENGLFQSLGVTQQTQTDTSHKPTEIVQNKQNIETAASTQPASKDMTQQTEEKEIQGLQMQMRQSSLPGPDKNVTAKKVIDMSMENNLASSEKIQQTAETAVKTRKHGFEPNLVEQVEKQDSLNTSNKTLQEKSLSVKSSDRRSAANTEETIEAKVIDKSTIQREKASPVKTNAIQESKAVNKEYLKPVTRAADGTLAFREGKNITSEKLAQSVRALSSDQSKSRDRNLPKENPKSEIEEKKEVVNYVKPVTRRAESEVLKVEQANTSGKIVPSASINKKVATPLGEAINKPNTTIDVTRNSNNEIDQSKSQVCRPLRCANVSLKISESPLVTDTQRPQSSRESLDSPTWSDNPMLKFKMTVKEMAELVESASLTKFARERKKKAKQILNKKQNGGSKTVSMKNSTKSLRSRVFKKKTGSTVKKVYGTRLSTSSKTEADARSDCGESSHRYATRNTGIKSTGDMNASAVDKHSKQQLNNQECTKENRSLSENSCSEELNHPTESLEKTTLNSRRKEFLAAKRDQRRKFLLANKTASPRKESPDKSLQTRSRSTKEMTSVESPSPVKSKKKETIQDNEKQQQTEKRIPVLRKYRFKKEVEPDEKIKMKTTETKPAINEIATQHIPRRISDRIKSHKNESETTDADKISSVGNEDKILSNAINERPSRRSASHESSLQKNSTQSRAKSASFERPRRIAMQLNTQKENFSRTKRARSSDNIQSSEVSSSGPVVENLQPLSHESGLEMLNPSAMPNQSENEAHSLVKTSKIQKASQGSNNVKSPHDVYVTSNRLESYPELDKVPQPASTAVESDKKENISRVHQTRLSTGSISHVDKSVKIIAKELSSSAEDSSSELPSNKTSKDKTVRKRNLSAPHQTVKVEPKRYSLSTGVIQCSACNKAFWKTKSYTVHIMKSPCGKKLTERKTEDTKESLNRTVNLQPAEEINADLSEKSSKVLTSNKVDQVTFDSMKRNDAADHRPNMKRTFSTSPKTMTEPCQSSEDSFGHTKAKRPRLEPEKSARKESVGRNEYKLATRNEIENNKSENKIAVEEFSKDLIVECSDSTKDLGQIPIENEKSETYICKGNDLSELPGTSKDFFDEDSDTSSEFSGFSEADISFPKYPENISDLDSDDSFKSYSGEDYNESSYHGDESCIASDDFLEKECPEVDKRKFVSVEEIWVDKKPGMPVTEKSKSNRIYVMDTDRSNKLHCQDKINIDSFVDEDNLKCLRCDKEFSSVSNVRLHVIRHLGWKRYQCKLCSVYSSYNLSEVRLHLWRKHDIREKHDIDLQKHIIDLNKEAGKKRCSKRMKTIQKKKEIENPSMQGDNVLESKRLPRKGTMQKKDTHTIDSVGTFDTDSLNLSEAANHMQLSKNRYQHLGANRTASAANSGGKVSSQNESGDIGTQKSPRNVFEDTCRYLQRPTSEKNSIGIDKAEDCSTKDISEGMKLKIPSGGSSPIKKSVRLAAKEDRRKSATEILKGPKTSPKKLNVSPSSGEKKSLPRQLEKSPPPVIEHDKADESPLVKARQMLAMILK